MGNVATDEFEESEESPRDGWTKHAGRPIDVYSEMSGVPLRINGFEFVAGRDVVVERARFERLREYVNAEETRKAAELRFGEAHGAVYDRCAAAEQALLATDLDPLP